MNRENLNLEVKIKITELNHIRSLINNNTNEKIKRNKYLDDRRLNAIIS